MDEINVEAEHIIKLEKEIKEEPEEESIEDMYGSEAYLNIAEGSQEGSAQNCLPSTSEDLAEEIKPPLAIFIQSNVENQEEEEGDKTVECEQDPLSVGVDNVPVIKEENVLDSIMEEAVSDTGFGDVGDTIQFEDNTSIPVLVQWSEPMKIQKTTRSLRSKEIFPKSAEHVRNILDDSEGPLTRDAACQRSYAAKAHTTDHTYVLSAEKLCQCDVCRLSSEARPLFCGKEDGGKANGRVAGKGVATNTAKYLRTIKFPCDICKILFKTKMHLSRHMVVHGHNEENPNKKRRKNYADDSVPQTEKLPFACKICGLQFSRRNSLTNHVLTHNDDDSKGHNDFRKRLKINVGKIFNRRSVKKVPLTCPICRKITKTKSGFSRHMLAHRTRNETLESVVLILNKERSEKDAVKCVTSQTAEESFWCKICNWRFSWRRHLTQHNILVHRAGKAKSNKSNAFTVNDNKSKKDGHCRAKTVTEQRNQRVNISCQNLDEKTDSFTETLSNEDPDKHFSSELALEAFYCGICNSTFRLKSYLNRHINLYTKRRKTRNKITYKNSVAFIHASSREKPYGCNICKVTFDTTDQLSDHMCKRPNQTCASGISEQVLHSTETHSKKMDSNEKETYECAVCKVTFDSSEQLTQHMPSHKTTHEGAVHKKQLDTKDFSCRLSVCKKIEHYCKVCKQTFDSREELDKHSNLQYARLL